MIRNPEIREKISKYLSFYPRKYISAREIAKDLQLDPRLVGTHLLQLSKQYNYKRISNRYWKIK